MDVDRQAVQSPMGQGANEKPIYTLATTPWGSNPTNVTVKAYDETESYKDVTATVLSGSASVVGDVITLPTVQGLTDGHRYRIEVGFTVNGSVLEAYLILVGQR